jgi:hypothetical protein
LKKLLLVGFAGVLLEFWNFFLYTCRVQEKPRGGTGSSVLVLLNGFKLNFVERGTGYNNKSVESGKD